MTPETQQIAIAKACPDLVAKHEHGPGHVWNRGPLRPFDPLNDLNAMRAAWRSLTDEQSTKAAWMLVQVLDGFQTWTPDEYETLNCWEMSLNDISDCINAIPAQYAEAFLRTLNLWKD